MKEKFKELLNQSTNPPWDGELGAANEFNLEKFSELIVLECCKFTQEEYTRDFDALWRDDFVNQIKQHFGVE
jgi:hypothetical protein